MSAEASTDSEHTHGKAALAERRLTVRRAQAIVWIAVVFVGQAAVIFGRQPPLRGAAYWPFIDYPMFSAAFTEGDRIPSRTLQAVFADGSLLDLTPELLGLTPYRFTLYLVAPLELGSQGAILPFIRRLERAHNTSVSELRLHTIWKQCQAGSLRDEQSVVQVLPRARWDSSAKEPMQNELR